MNGVDIAVIVIVCVAFAAAVGRLIYRKVKHKGGCCDCGSCNGCTACKSAQPDGKSCPHCNGENKK